MKRLGEVVRVAQGLAIVRLAGADGEGSDGDIPALGTEVVAESLDTVGDVVDVFGPTDAPYCSVSPATDVRVATLVGQPLYARD